jgi:preprotein translocase subunit SecA
VLNAKQHEREAHIVANAGAPGAVTIATNMAGRGTDIVLGGSLEAELAALGEECRRRRSRADQGRMAGPPRRGQGGRRPAHRRHRAPRIRRIDNQLRGRSGRQGDPGSSRFYLSLEDNLMRIFAADWVQKVMARMGLKEDDIIESPLVTKQIANAQRKVEAHNFDIRKNLLDFDDVNNDQRKVIYGQRDELLEADSVKANIDGIRSDVVADLVERFVPADSVDDQWDLPGLEAELATEFALQLPLVRMHQEQDELDASQILAKVQESVEELFQAKEAQVGGETMRMLEKHVMLNVLDQNWKEHLGRMDYLRQGIHLRGYAQKQPKQEYKKEAFELFSELLEKVKREVISLLARIRVRDEAEVAAAEAEERARAEAVARQMQFQHPDMGGLGADEEAAAVQQLGQQPQGYGEAFDRIGRNDPCPCGSGKKFKHCHGQLA